MKTTHLRCKHIIRSDEGEEHFKSINAAKRKSREIQGSALGRGVVRVVEKLP